MTEKPILSLIGENYTRFIKKILVANLHADVRRILN